MKKTKLPKSKIWSTLRADKEFSKWIRERDGECQFPGCFETEYLQNSHFWPRARAATRYDPDNCIALCYRHHYGDRQMGFEYAKQGRYMEFMKRRLGEEKYEALEKRFYSTVKLTDAKIALQAKLRELQ